MHSFEQEAQILDKKYRLGKTIGRGEYGKVKIAEDIKTRTKFAIKFFRASHLGKNEAALNLFVNEATYLKSFKNDNVVKALDTSISKGRVTDEYDVEIKEKISYIVMEYLEKGDMFDLVKAKHKFPLTIARFFFKQLIDGISYLQKNNICNRDIKLENIVLDHKFQLKIIDFGFLCPITNDQNCPIYYDEVWGTDGYMAPEINKGRYTTEKVDIFSAAVVLFIMITGHPPFYKATKYDKYYSMIMGSEKQFYWNKVLQRTPLTNDTIDLMSKMFAYDPKERIDLEGINNSDFLNGQIASLEEVKKFFE